MLNSLPEIVQRQIGESFKDGVLKAQEGFMYGREDEDVLTGALGQSLVARGYIEIEGEKFKWKTSYSKFRGRGKNATEKLLGADGIFQIELVNESEEPLFRKGLLFQAKKGWEGKDSNLQGQAKQLTAFGDFGFIINYTSEGYEAFSATIVQEANGDRREISQDNTKRLIDVLGTDFVVCRSGKTGLWYDIYSRKLHLPISHKPIPRAYRHVITTTIVQIDR